MSKYLVLKSFTVYHEDEKGEQQLGYYEPGMTFEDDNSDGDSKIFAAMIEQRQIERVRAD